jgi:signal peptidase II
MAKSGGSGQWRWLWLTFAVLVLDLGSKSVASFYLGSLTAMVITPFLNLILVHNTGSAFSFLSDQNGWQLWLFVGIAIAVSIGILAYLWRAALHPFAAAALCLILGGTLGNLYNRIVYGYVIDFIQLHYKDFYWPTFNVADSAITLGVIFILLSAFRSN